MAGYSDIGDTEEVSAKLSARAVNTAWFTPTRGKQAVARAQRAIADTIELAMRASEGVKLMQSAGKESKRTLGVIYCSSKLHPAWALTWHKNCSI